MSDAEAARTLNAIAARQAARSAIDCFGAEDDEIALADQFEAAGLDSLARHGLDARTKIPEPEGES